MRISVAEIVYTAQPTRLFTVSEKTHCLLGKLVCVRLHILNSSQAQLICYLRRRQFHCKYFSAAASAICTPQTVHLQRLIYDGQLWQLRASDTSPLRSPMFSNVCKHHHLSPTWHMKAPAAAVLHDFVGKQQLTEQACPASKCKLRKRVTIPCEIGVKSSAGVELKDVEFSTASRSREPGRQPTAASVITHAVRIFLFIRNAQMSTFL